MNNFKFLRGYEVVLLNNGRAFLEAGYVWAPYIPMVTSSVINEPYGNRRIYPQEILSRYARRTVDSRFYETINVTH